MIVVVIRSSFLLLTTSTLFLRLKSHKQSILLKQSRKSKTKSSAYTRISGNPSMRWWARSEHRLLSVPYHTFPLIVASWRLFTDPDVSTSFVMDELVQIVSSEVHNKQLPPKWLPPLEGTLAYVFYNEELEPLTEFKHTKRCSTAAAKEQATSLLLAYLDAIPKCQWKDCNFDLSTLGEERIDHIAEYYYVTSRSKRLHCYWEDKCTSKFKTKGELTQYAMTAYQLLLTAEPSDFYIWCLYCQAWILGFHVRDLYI